MLHFSRTKTILTLALCLIGLLLPIPSFLSEATYKSLPQWAQHRINLGLDLRGGAHLLFEIDTGNIVRKWLETLRQEAVTKLKEGSIDLAGATLSANTLTVRLAKADDTQRALKRLEPLSQQVGAAIFTNTGADLAIKSAELGTITITPTEQGLQLRIGSAIEAARETINRRINALGTSESTVVRQGRDRILIQYPGLQETGPLKELVGTTAELNFHQVYTEGTYDPSQPAPLGFKLYDYVEDGRNEGRRLLLRETPIVRGDELSSAFERLNERNQWVISFTFKNSGAVKFGRFTEKNVDKPFAIVLDGKVISAPTIESAIRGGSGIITGGGAGFRQKDAQTLAVQLRSGALPAKLTVVEERVVGASLGQDSIEAGKRAAIIAAVLVAGFMIFAYGMFGVFATLGAALHVVLVIAIMALIGSTLTLPGIAGIVLTIGMAVDANVLIYERIREELRNGRTPIMAIESGFKLAYATIFDSQLTTFIAGVLMFWLGSGPVRGFAVTLTLGILTTIFTAVTVTRLLVVVWIRSYKPKPVPAPL